MIPTDPKSWEEFDADLLVEILKKDGYACPCEFDYKHDPEREINDKLETLAEKGFIEEGIADGFVVRENALKPAVKDYSDQLHLFETQLS